MRGRHSGSPVLLPQGGLVEKPRPIVPDHRARKGAFRSLTWSTTRAAHRPLPCADRPSRIRDAGNITSRSACLTRNASLARVLSILRSAVALFTPEAPSSSCPWNAPQAGTRRGVRAQRTCSAVGGARCPGWWRPLPVTPPLEFVGSTQHTVPSMSCFPRDSARARVVVVLACSKEPQSIAASSSQSPIVDEA